MTAKLKTPPKEIVQFTVGDRKIPVEALRFDAGPFMFGEATAEGKTVPVSILARTSQPIDHWYWGRIVHDMAGFKSAATVAIDYGHSQSEALGCLDQFDADPVKGLGCKGKFITINPDDRASEVIQKGKAGFPYQASIYFDEYSCILEWVPEGMTSPVNGYQFEGPGVIVREWDLRGVAVCLYGADKNTSTKFSATENGAKVTIISQEKDTQMSVTEKASPTREQFAAELTKFTTAFGSTNGVEWFNAGKSYEDAMGLHATELQTQLSAARTELSTKLTEKETEFSAKLAERDQKIVALETKLTAAKDGVGEKQLSGGDPIANQPDKTKFKNVSEGQAAFAAGMKMPSKK